MEDSSKGLAGLDARKRHLLSLLLKEKGVDPLQAPITPQSRAPHKETIAFPLSFEQERLWVIEQIEPGNVAYNLPFGLRLTGPLDLEVLDRTFTEVVRRHQTLRTTYRSTGGRPEQVVHPAAPVSLPLVDLAGLPAEVIETELVRLSLIETSRPFDLTRSVMAGVLLRLSPPRKQEIHALLLTLHHIASDGWSNGILAREVIAIYEAFLDGRPSPLPELAIQYVDFAVWQRETLRGALLDEQIAFWRERLSGVPILDLPTDFPRPAVPSIVGGGVMTTMSAELSNGVRELARAEAVTLFMLIGAAYQALLSRYTGQIDLSFGTPIANRHRTETEALIGFFANTLVIRADLSGDPTFRELLRRTRKAATEAFAHQVLPFSKVVEALNPERSLAHSPLFQVMLGIGNAPSANLEVRGLTFEALDGRYQTSMFDLNLLVIEKKGRLEPLLEYRLDLFEKATAERLLRHFETLLSGAVEDPARRLSELPLLSGAEREQVLGEWARGERRIAEDHEERCVHDQIAALAAEEPERPALAALEGEVTRGELNRRANRLAHRLIALGVGPEVRAGLCLRDPAAMVTGMLAVLKAGGAYVPLDAAYPRERLAFLAEDARLAAVLVDDETGGLVPDVAGLERLRVEEVFSGPGNEADPAPRAGFGNPAYVLYTSGSTGRPKGVMITHRSLADLVASNIRLFGLTPDDRYLQLVSFNFDVSVAEIFPTLAAGATLVLTDRRALMAGDALASALRGATVAFIPPPVLSTVPAGESFPELRALAVGGEKCPAELAGRWAPGRLFLNIYGPTENCVDAVIWAAPKELPAGGPPIGWPVPNTDVRIFDRHGALAPVGVPGELFIAGIGLARGYLDRPDLTAERFLPDPFAERPGERLYRTGDLVRWRPDSQIDYLGRIDHQVKVRGVRVETGEIESVLREHPAVRDAAVIPVRDAAGTALHAFAVIETPGAVSEGDLRAFLRERLPELLLPSRLSILDALPLTPNGKLDRRALARQESEEIFGRQTAQWVAPREGTETQLAELWGEVLGLPRVGGVGAMDDFFELGGHSLLATQLVSRIREAFQVDLPQRALFEAPTLAGLAARLDGLTGRGGGLIAFGAEPIAGRAPAEGPYPLSFSQERLWILDQIEPGSSAYNIPVALDLTGDLRPAVLAAALTEIVRRHETLRTTFGVAGGKPVQIVAPAAPVEIPRADLTALPAALRQDEALRLAHEEAVRPFDLANGPVLRTLMVRWDGAGQEKPEPARNAVIFNVHHIASDGWSNGVLVREVTALYAAFDEGRTSPLPELGVRYVDYASWQRDLLQGEALEAELRYWRDQLAGVPALLELPTDRPRPAVQGIAGATEGWELDPGVSGALAALAQREGATLFMVMTAAFQALLSRYTHQTDVPVGTPVAGRDRTELEGLIGFFVNTLVIRTDLAGDPSFRDVLGRVRRVALDAFAHQILPFEKIVEELNPERSLAHSPLFQVMLALQNAPEPALEMRGITFGALEVDPGVAKFDLTFTVGEAHVAGESRLMGAMEYRTDLFDAATVRRMLGHFSNLLAGIAADPERELSDLPLLAPAEQDEIVFGWNATAVPFDLDRCLHEMVAEQAARTPEAPAVVSEDTAWTYRELMARAGRLAATLRELGVGPEVIVGLYAARSPEMIAAILGVWQAGGAYVPLEPSYPAERLRYMLEDTGTPVVLTQSNLAERLPLPEGVRMVLLDGEQGEAPSPIPPRSALPDNLMAVLYTSGSTGRPKGVALRHRGFVNRFLAAQAALRLGPADTILFKASMAFDFSIWEAIAPLCAGARVAVARPEGQQDAAYILQALLRWDVTVLHFVPSMLAVFLNEPGIEQLTRLRQAICGGEALTPELVTRFYSRLSHLRAPLENEYGPTEISIDTTRWTCEPEPDAWRVPIGRPIENTRIHLLDPALRPVPPLVSGKLYVGGVGVARSYLGRPDLTAERFVPDPFGEAGGRLYDTRDLARYRPDGVVEFLGRADTQVKIRGIRIEPGEIEALLREHPGVEAAAVVPGQDANGAMRLLGFFVPRPGADVSPADLRAHLRGELPEAMLPSLLTRVDSLSFTASGKLDRLALSRMGTEAPTGAEKVAPRSETEELLAGIWAGVLELGEVGVHDDFFELGGHSLLATQLVSRVRGVFEVELPQRALFEAPTVAGLAERIEALRGQSGTGSGAGLPPIDPAELGRLEGPPRLSFAQERLWVIDQLEPGSNAYNIPVALRLLGDLDRRALAAALTEVVRRHETLRTTFTTVLEDGEAVPVQVIHSMESVGSLPLPFVDLSGLPEGQREAEIRAIAQIAGGQPFDLTTDLMLRGVLVDLTADGGSRGRREHALFLTVHHISSDGWSSGVLVRETVALYEAFSAGRPSPLPELPIRYADYARWQRRILHGETLEAMLGYWRRQLAGVPVLELPADRPRPAIQRPGGANEGFWIPREVAEGLKALGRREGATLFMVLMTAFQALLARVTGQVDVPVGIPVAGRRREELEGLIGFFVNTLVIRGDLSGDPTVPEMLGRIRSVALDAFAHQDVPFERLVEELNPERSFSHSPLFQVMLVLLNTPDAALDTIGLAFEPLETGEITAKFDLTFQLAESPEGLGGSVEYRPDLFDRATVARLIEHFQILLAGLVEDPSRRLSELPLLTEDERVLLAQWNDTAWPQPVWSLEGRLAEVAAALSEAPAVVFEGRSYSYAAMDAATRRLAARLRELGVGPDVRVGVCAERSPEMIAAVLAVVRAGGAYVPIDPTYPAERIALMLGDSAAPVLLTQERLLTALPPFEGQVGILDALFAASPEGEVPDLPIPAADPDNLLYVIYTSGSTGRPKGVALPRRALANLLDWQGREPLPGPARTLQFASLSFDVSFQEIFSTWLGGGTLVLVSEETRRDPHALLALFESERIERAFLPVVALRQLADAVETDGAGSSGGIYVRDVIAAGEQLQVSPAVRSWFERLPGGRLHNHYGPTETHATTAFTLDGDPGDWPVLVPIGRPMPNHRIHLLDAHLGAVPIGSLGEVCAAGAGLARGYLDRPDLTAEKFVPDPFGEPGDRLYRVGDLARWRWDGVLEYAGRRDGQVKVRGVRVEIGEVEAALALHPRVRQAVVLASPDTDGALRLVAFYVPETESPAEPGQLRDFLRDRLPAPYIPATFVPVEAFPLTPSGKVDRRTLAKREVEPTDTPTVGYVAPRTQTEELLASIWAALLGVSRVGLHESFFDLGGHSLLATQLVSRVRRTFGVELPQRALFEAPTVAELALRVEDAQRAGFSEALAPLGPIEPGTADDRLPRLSFAQERLWVLGQMDAESAAYNLPVALRIAGRLDPAVLAATFAEVARRHATLRTTYGVISGDRRPVQIVAPPGPVPLSIVDLSALPEERREGEVGRLAEEEANRPFDLGTGPVLRVELVRLGTEDHALLLNVHHIASDGWSNGVLVREVTELYAAFSEGRPSPLPELPIQYVDFARWQRRALRGEALDATLAYWRRQLANVPVLELPTDRPRPAFQSPAGATEAVELGADLAAGLKDLVRREGATLFMGVMAAFQALLHRYSGQSDFAVGTPVAGRNRIETEGLIGFFVNTLVIRSDFREDPPFSELLRRVRRNSLEAFAYQDLPFEKLVEELNPERSLAHTPLFQVMAALQNTPGGTLEIPGLTFTPLEAPGHSAKFDLTMSLLEAPEGLLGAVEYRTALFDPDTMRRMLGRGGHLATLLASALAEPGRPVSELPLLPAAEREQLVVGWNDTERPGFDEGLLHGLFAERACELPDAPALWSAGSTVSYGELYARVVRLAHRLRELGVGVGPEVRVGVCQDRSVEMIVAVMGVLTAGGAYVPLDPSYPADRLAFMAEDAGIVAVVVNERTIDRAPGGPPVRRVLVEDAASLPSLESLPSLPSFPEVHSDHLAYVIYTSGSTGRPKGVAISHRGAVNTIRATIERLRLAPGERFLQFASLSFDGSVAEIFSTLGSGACLCLIGREALPSGEVLAAALRQPDVTVALIPPSVLATLGEQRFPSLHTLNVSAEKCPAEIVRQWAPGRRFLNIYGPTEASVYMTIWEAGEGAPGAGFEAAPPIGVPIANSRVFVLDRSGAPVPVGVPGELFLGGLCLARGYFGRPDKTAETFVPDPFADRFGRWYDEAGGRLYRTGDLCRWRSDGHLEMLGRIDHQVKVRGFRIELGEIESVLLEHPAVRRAAVLSRPGPGGPRLVAYVVPDDAVAGVYDPLSTTLRSHLRDKLPDYMVPAAFVELPELPITTSGKLDRAALPEPGGERPELATAYVAPHGGLESALTEIWQDALGVQRVGIEDNFFDLGGHSLLMVDVQSRVRERLGREVSLLELFRYPNIGTLARFLEEGEAGPVLATEARVDSRPGSRDIAVIGMAARFPGAPDLETFWRRLRAGDELITFFTEEELVAAGIPREMAADPAYVPASGVLEDSDFFDAGLFDINPREAQLMDPQQRILLECSLEAMERSGYGAGSLSMAGSDGSSKGPRVGVYAGGGMSSYGLHNLFGRAVGSGLEVTLGNDKDYLATRVAYKLNLRGPAFTVQTACSTSLVAIHVACKALLDGECDMALAGGVTVQYPMHAGYFYEEGGVLSEDGHTYTFDARAHGTVNSNGVGVVMLKPLAAALADGDPVHAVIKASAINNDGGEKIGFTAPSEEGQSQVIAEAQALAGVAPETLRFVETHGTATPVGDPIEVAALTRAFRNRGSRRRQFCALGSVKTNLGHTGSAAGVAGFLKTALAVEHGEIPPSLHFEIPNPALLLEGSPFYVATDLTPWPLEEGLPRRAAVSSFGLGGTNAHVVLEQAPGREPSGPSRAWQAVCLSARSQAALEVATDRLVNFLRAGESAELPPGLPDIVFTLSVGRKGWEHRRVVVCRDREEAIAALETRDPQKVLGSALPRGGVSGRPVAFVFSGLGEQYPGMAAGLYRDEPTFREAFDRCAALLEPALGVDLGKLLFEGGAQEEENGGGMDLRRLLGRGDRSAGGTELGPLDRTAVLQPALFAVEYALAEMWRGWGVEPRAVIGYSLGEYVAACVAGVLSLEDALRLVAERARLIDALPEGAMLAVSIPEADVLPLLEGTELSLAAVNGPSLSVVAGPVAAVETLEERLKGDEIGIGIAHRRLRTTHAFHSRMMEPAAAPLAAFVQTLALRPPRIPYVSNVTGTWITPEQATDPGYWAEHLRHTVRFSEGIGELWRGAERVLLEIGPGGSLAALALQHPAASASSDPVALSTLRSSYERRPDQAFLLGALGKLWLAGVRVDWRAFYARERRQRVALPTYPFERQRYWIEVQQEVGYEAAPAGSQTGLYTSAWRQSSSLPAPASDTLTTGNWLIFAEPGSGLGDSLVRRLRERGATVATVAPGESFAQPARGTYVLDPHKTEDYDALLGALLQQWGAPPDRIVHLWTAFGTGDPSFDHAQERGFYSLLFLTQSLARWQMSTGSEPASLRALVASSGVYRVTGVDELRFESAPLATLCRSLSLEVPGVVCRFVDVARASQTSQRRDDRLAEALFGEMFADEPEAAVVFRGGERWVRSFEPVRDTGEPDASLPENGVLLLTGRPDPLLIQAAAEVARLAGARCALLEDRPEPGELAESPAGVQAAWGVDMGDEESVRAALVRVAESVGPIAGVLAADVPGSEPPAVMSAYVTREHADGFLRAAAGRLSALAGALDSLGDKAPRFCAVVTSLAPLAVEPDRALLAALESMVDTFARQREAEGETAWTSIAWDRGVAAGAIRGDLVVLALRRILALIAAGAPPQVVLSPEDLTVRLRRAAAVRPGEAGVSASEGAAGPFTRHARPNLRNPYVAPESETEKAVTEIWQGLLGLEQVGIHDSFFDLGGDSLLATQIFTRLREMYGVEIPLTAFFEQPTSAAIAAQIDAVRAQGETETDKLARMLEQLENLSPEDVERMLAERGISEISLDS